MYVVNIWQRSYWMLHATHSDFRPISKYNYWFRFSMDIPRFIFIYIFMFIICKIFWYVYLLIKRMQYTASSYVRCNLINLEISIRVVSKQVGSHQNNWHWFKFFTIHLNQCLENKDFLMKASTEGSIQY